MDKNEHKNIMATYLQDSRLPMKATLKRLCEAVDSLEYVTREIELAVCGVINSFGADRIDEIRDLCKNKFPCLVRYAEEVKQPHERRSYKIREFVLYKHNETITELLRMYENHRSGKVMYARKDLKQRFVAQSRKDQIRIVKAFLSSGSQADREWAAREADRYWHSSFGDGITNAMKIKPTKSIAITATRYLPISYVKENFEVLKELAPMDVCIKLGKDSDFDTNGLGLNIFDYLYATAKAGLIIPESAAEIEVKFFTYLYKCLMDWVDEICTYRSGIDSIPGLCRAVWALGVHGMTDLLLLLIDFFTYAAKDICYGFQEQFRTALDWIEYGWDIDNKEELLVKSQYGQEEAVEIKTESGKRMNRVASMEEVVTQLESKPFVQEADSDVDRMQVKIKGLFDDIW